MSSSEVQRGIWDRVFREVDPGTESGDDWLGRWTDVLADRPHLPVLELGCGSGQDTRFLVNSGLDVLATDFSEEALRLTRGNAPGSKTMMLDISEPLPFPEDTFGVVVAGLSLHYFPWKTTESIVSEVRRVLSDGGYLLARLNSTSDEFHSAAREEIERNYYRIRGIPRRLFDRESIEVLFRERWLVENTEELTTGRFGRTKTLWEVCVRKRA